MTQKESRETTARVLRLSEPLSLWGGLDPATGVITDPRHPQCGRCLTGRLLVMPGTTGSTSGPSVLADCLRQGTGPVAIMMAEMDSSILAAVGIAEVLYDTLCNVLLKPEADWPEDDAVIALPEGPAVIFASRKD